MTLKELIIQRKNILRQARAATDPTKKIELLAQANAILGQMEASDESLTTEDAYGLMAH